MVNKKIIVIFPGANYNSDCPLLYYAGFKYEMLGYEKVKISYNDLIKSEKTSIEYIEDINDYVLSQLQAFDLSKYDDIIFVSKSLGTIVAGWVEEKLSIKVRHIYLTPLKETLQYINNNKNIIKVIAGTKDKYLKAELLKEHCEKENISLKQIEGVGHRLEIWGDIDRNIQILREIVALY